MGSPASSRPLPASRARGRRLALVVALAALVGLAAPDPLSAQSRYSTSEARELFVRGAELERRAGERATSGDADGEEALLEEAAEVYREAVERDPDLAEAWARLGFVLYLLDRADEAVELLEPARERAPDSVDLQHALGVNLFAVGRKDEAAALLGAVVAARDDAADALFLLGVYHLDAKRDDAAREHFERYRALAPEDAQVHRALATLALRGRDWPRALDALERLVELEPADVTAHVNLGHVHFEEQRLDLAIASYRRALELDPQRYEVAYDLASVHYLDGDCAAASRELDRVLELRPQHFGALYFRADCALLDASSSASGSPERLDEAERRFVALLEARPSYLYGYLKLAQIALLRGDTRGAEARLREVDLSTSEDADVLALGGRLLRRLERVDDAIAVHQRLVELHPAVGEHHMLLGIAVLDAGRPGEALAHLERATDLDPTWAPAWRALSAGLLHQAAALADTDPTQAEALLERALELDHHPLEARVDLAIVALRLGDDTRAATLLAEARALEPQAPSVARLEAALLVREGRFAEVVERLEPLAALEQGMTAASWNDLAVARAGLDDWEAADEAIERARALDAADPHNLALIKLRLGLSHARGGRWRKAEKLFDEAAVHADALAGLERLRLEFALGISALEGGRFARAERHLTATRDGAAALSRKERRALTGSDELDLDLELAYAQYRSGKLAEAAELIGKKPRGEAARLMRAVREALAVEALRNGKIADAREHLELATSGEEASVAARLNLAVVLYRLGDPGRASTVFAKLAEQGVPEAMYDYALYLDEVANQPRQAIAWYERYVEAGGRRKDAVEERLAIKRRVWGPAADGRGTP